ncbi:hypothetical protein [Krasilnikovia sp. MM14-A1004]|uniref:hypothetical protein n=1 Tax=Krasilnikovia sp. MM14-A1004 TaxID=3373541 RepID=UPI00399D4099
MTQPPGSWSGGPFDAPPPTPTAPFPPATSGHVLPPGPVRAAAPYPSLTAVPPPPAPADRWRPARVDPVMGTEFGLVQYTVPPIASGLATGAMIAGIASILVSFLVFCFGLSGASEGWGGWVGGAFALLAVLAGGGAIGVGLVGLRQIRRSGESGRARFTGRGRAIAGISCGGVGAGLALVALVLTLLLQFS